MASWIDKATSFDDLSMVLGASLVLAYAFAKWATPVSLVHPLLLGRQADAGKVRKAGESAIYRNYGTGSINPVSIIPPSYISLTAGFSCRVALQDAY